MTHEMFIGGLMILTLVAGLVIAMTSSRQSPTSDRDSNKWSSKDQNDRGPSAR